MENSLDEEGMHLQLWGWFPDSSARGKQVLLGITKCGDQYIRSMLIHGARAVLFRASEKTDSLSMWVNRIREKRGFNRAVVALANKLLRIAWIIIARNEMYLPAI